MLIPRPIRQIVGAFRGEAAPFMILLSVAAGFWFGLLPGFQGLNVFLLALVLVLNVNIGIFLLSALVGKLACFAAAPLLYHAGVWVHESLPVLLRVLSKIPIVAISDFDRYAVAGATVVGPIVGTVLGLLLAKSVQRYRQAWLRLEENSEAYRAWRSKGWVRFLDRILLGKKTADIRGVLSRRPKYVRKAGVVAAALLVVGSGLGIQFVQDRIARQHIAEALTQAYGAQVDIDKIDIKLLGGSVDVTGIAVTDREHPQNNKIAIGGISAAASWSNLLLGRLVLNNVALSAVTLDQPRATPGKVLPRAEKKERSFTFDPSQYNLPNVSVAELDSYFDDAKAIKERLKQLQEWLPQGRDKQAAKRERQVPEEYLAYLRARSPVSGMPRIIVQQLDLDKIVLPEEEFGNSRITCKNISAAPDAARLPVKIEIKSLDRPTSIEIVFHHDAPEGGTSIKGVYGDVDLQRLQKRLSKKNPVTFRRGMASGSIEGKATTDSIDLGLAVKTQNMQLDSTGDGVFGLDPGVSSEAMKALEHMDLKLRLVGPITQPRLVFDEKGMRESMGNALVAAGKGELAKRIPGAAGVNLPGIGAGGPAAATKDPLKTGADITGGILGATKEKKDKK